ncbi:MAG: OmpA family protein [Candidatus Eisenbacteria bacterium]|nr:OmpA family protein [Candidatus Eisenbacteria bacterium]
MTIDSRSLGSRSGHRRSTRSLSGIQRSSGGASLLLALLLGVALVLSLSAGCGGKKTQSAPGAIDEPIATGSPEEVAPATWSYEIDLGPGVQGSPQERIIVWNFPKAGSASLDPEARGAAKLAIEKLRSAGSLETARLLVVGFADSVQEHSGAEALGMRRAEAAGKALVDLGIPESNLNLASAGDRTSRAKEFEKIRQAYERRVEVWTLR